MLVDILRRAKVNVTVASVEKSKRIIGSQNIKLMVDSSITDSSKSTYDLIILPVRQSLLPSSLCLEHFILIIMNFFCLNCCHINLLLTTGFRLHVLPKSF